MLLTHLNPPELTRWLQAGRARQLKGRRHIGYWAWELPHAPESWRQALNYVDEVWAPSNFSAEAFRRLAPDAPPVRVVPHPIFAMPEARPDREAFGLEPEACAVLAAIDVRSTVARKNPFGALEAYLRAVPRPDGRSVLICKVSNLDADPLAAQRFRARFSGRDDVRVIDQTLSAANMSRLIASCDIVLSLHRAEGFGLLMAEGMWRGKPVIATGWSGNLDYMTDQSSILVPFRMTEVCDPQNMYGDAVWADPDLDFAAEALAVLLTDARARHALGRAAQVAAAATFDRQAWLARIDHFLSPTSFGLSA